MGVIEITKQLGLNKIPTIDKSLYYNYNLIIWFCVGHDPAFSTIEEHLGVENVNRNIINNINKKHYFKFVSEQDHYYIKWDYVTRHHDKQIQDRLLKEHALTKSRLILAGWPVTL